MKKASRISSERGTAKPPPAFRRVLDALRKLYGKPKAPAVTDPFELLLYENVAYLADDLRREEAFRRLKEEVGLSPERILAAAPAKLREIARGIIPMKTAERLREIAATALEEFGGDLREVVRLPTKEAIKALKIFPSVAYPSAQKILLFSKKLPVLALDSNGLRVLLRLGYGREEESYSKSYRSAQEAVSSQLKSDCDWLIEAHQLLRTHGQRLCKRSHPRCEACPLRGDCAYARREAGQSIFSSSDS